MCVVCFQYLKSFCLRGPYLMGGVWWGCWSWCCTVVRWLLAVLCLALHPGCRFDHSDELKVRWQWLFGACLGMRQVLLRVLVRVLLAKPVRRCSQAAGQGAVGYLGSMLL